MDYLIVINETELATILAALRYYQQEGLGDPANRPDEIHDIATSNEDVEIMSSLDDEGIDQLCEHLNCNSVKSPMYAVHEANSNELVSTTLFRRAADADEAIRGDEAGMSVVPIGVEWPFEDNPAVAVEVT